jgi:hypothetical protein
MEKQILFAIKSLEKKVVDIYSKMKNTGSSPAQLTLDAIIYNPEAPLDVKTAFGNVGTSQFLQHLIPLPDGKMIILGGFYKYQGVVVNGLARLNADFTLDTTYTGGGNRFLTGPSSNGQGLSMSSMSQTVLPFLDSSLNLYFIRESSYCYQSENSSRNSKIFKVDSLGNFDETFAAAIGTGPNATVHNILLLPDNGFIITGSFTAFNSTSFNRILRIDSNGSINTSFVTTMGTGFNGTVNQTVLTPTGKLLCLGEFTSYNGVARNNIVQLNIDGTIDYSFNYTSGITSFYSSNNRITINKNTGDIYCYLGGVIIYNGISTFKRVIRISSTGNYDASFASPPNHLAVNGGWWTMYFDTVLNKLYLGGGGYNWGTAFNNYLYRINTDGSLDTTYPLTPGEGLLSSMNYIIPLGTDYLYLSHYNYSSSWGNLSGEVHRGFTIINKHTGKLATKFTKSLNY